MRLLSRLLCSLVAASLAAALLHAQRQTVEVVTTAGPSAPGTVQLPVQQTGAGMLVGQVVDAAGSRPIAGAIVTIGGSLNAPGAGGGGPRVIMMGPGGAAMDPGGGPNQVPRVMTDSEGRFAFRNLPRGSFNLTAQKAGYLEGAYGRFRP